MNEHNDNSRFHSLPERRRFLFHAMTVTLSSTAVALLAGRPRLALAALHSDAGAAGDVQILNSALAAELQAIAAYQAGADSGLLSGGVLKVAQQFQGHHREHAAVLTATVERFGGRPAEAQAHYDFPTETLKSEADVLGFAAGLERAAVSAYAGAIPQFEHRDLSKAAASILADEAMHWSVLRQALGMSPVPGAFFS